MTEANPFDALDGVEPEGDVLHPGPPPSLLERFLVNREAAQYTTTLRGAVQGAGAESHERERALARYEGLPQWETPMEGLVALAGQLSAQNPIEAPENIIPMGLGAKAVEMVGWGAVKAATRARLAAGAIDAGAANLVTDSAIQGIEIGAGTRETYDPVQTAVGVGLGVAGSVGGQLAAKGIGKAATELKTAVRGGDFTRFTTPPAVQPTTVLKPVEAPSVQPKQSINLDKGFKGKTTPAIQIGNEVFIGETHSEALGKAVKQFGADSPEIKKFNDAADPLENIGIYDKKKGFVSHVSGDNGKEVIGNARETVKKVEALPPPPAPHEAVATPHQLGDELDHHARAVRGLPPREQVVEGRSGAVGLEDLNVKAAKTDNYNSFLRSNAPEFRRLIDEAKTELGPGQKTPPYIKDIELRLNELEPEVLAARTPRGKLAGQPERALGGTATLQGHPIAPATGRLIDVANKLTDALQAVVRQGRITLPGAAGTFNKKTGAIRLKSPDDFDVLSHELGHHLEESIGGPLKSLMQAHASELVPMAYAGAKKGSELQEGFAEYARLMLTNPVHAASLAPKFDAAFRQALAGPEHAHIGQAINDATKAYRQWLDQPSDTAVLSTIVSSKQPSAVGKAKKDLDRYGMGHTIKDYLGRFYATALDDLHPLNKAVQALSDIYKENAGKSLKLNAFDNPYKLARMSRGAWGAGHVDITSGIHPYRDVMRATGNTAPVSPSLRDAVILAMGSPNALSKWDDVMARRFGGYLWSRRALGEWERFDQGLVPNPPDKLTKGDHLLNIDEMERQHPQFTQAAKMVHEWAQALWTKKRDAGLITHEQWQEGMSIRDYVPGQRAFDQDYDPLGKGGKGSSAKGGIVRRFRGSRRDVINPIESLVRDAYETSMAIARNDVVKTLDRLATKVGRGGAHIAERIPSSEIKATVIDPLEAVQNAAKAAGMSKADAIMLRDAVESAIGDEKATVFRPAIINDKGEPIAFFRDGGELKALRLADGQFGLDMYKAMTSFTPQQQNIFIGLLAKAAAVKRAGIVTDIPFLITNFIRDQAMASILYGKPVTRFAQTLKGMGADIAQTGTARQYSVAQGLVGGSAVSGLHDLRVKRDIGTLKKEGWVGTHLTSLEGLLRSTEVSETGARIGLFNTFLKEAKARGLSEIEAMYEASWQARDYIDYNRHGSQMGGLARIIPFFNVALQGSDKIARHMIAPFFSGEGSAEAKATAVKSWARAAAITTIGMGIYAYNSQQEEFQDLNPQTKAANWLFRFGNQWLIVPKPFEMAAVINMGEAAWDAIAEKNPLWASQYRDGLIQMVMPPSILEGNPAISEAYQQLSGIDFFSRQPIVPDNLKGMEPWAQATQRTSDLFKKFGKLTNQSPALWEHAFLNATGSWGADLLALSDYALSDKPTPGWDEVPWTRRFIKDASRGAFSTRAFWDLVAQDTGKLEGSRKTWQFFNDSGDPAGAADFLAQQDDITKTWITAGSIDAGARRIHPLLNSRNAVQAIGALRKELSNGDITTADGKVHVPRIERGAADDILAKLSSMQAHNALSVMQVPGFANRQIYDETTFHRELRELSPTIAQALADRFKTNNAIPFATVQRLWPDLQDRLRLDGSEAIVSDLASQAKAESYFDDLGEGTKLKRKKRSVVPGE